MDIQQQIEYWRQTSEDDLEAAEALFNYRKFRQALFFAHLSMEKILKSYVVKNTQAVPPKIHDLLRLMKLADLHLSDLQQATLARIQRYCQEGRYPNLQLLLPTEDVAKRVLQEARSIYSWLANQLK